MSQTLWRFSALDSLFFRDGQPMNMGESAWIDSRFPPTGRTLQGAVRTTILEHLGADIAAFQRGDPCLPGDGSLQEAIGDAQGIGRMRLTGPFLHYRGEPWLPAPLDLVRTGREGYALLRPAETATRCDLGRIRLPVAPGVKGRFRDLAGEYLSRSALGRLLRGGARLAPEEHLPLLAETADEAALADREPKVGLARDNRRRTHRPSMLYAIAPVRPRLGVELHLAVAGLEPDWYPPSPFPCLLGGGKRIAAVRVEEPEFRWPGPVLNETQDRIRFKIVFLTPVRFPSGGWLPEGFKPQTRQGIDCWRGRVQGAEFEILCAALGRPERIGAWNLKDGQPQSLQAYLPAGSLYFCEAEPGQREAITGLHDTRIGEMTAYGFGHLLIGQW